MTKTITQSKTIGEQLNNIRSSIAQVVTASASSSQAFSAVPAQITSTDQLVRQIKSAMEEQQEGSQQITEALHSMNGSMEEMAIGEKKINETGTLLSSISDQVKDSIVTIGNQIDQFHV